MRRSLPTDAEVRDILSRKRTRPAPRPAPPAGRALTKMVRELDERFGKGAGALEPRWREIVGERLARVTRPQKLTRGKPGQGGTLELRVAGPAALLVQHQSAEILERVNLFLGPGSVERLRIAQGPVAPLQSSPDKPKRVDRRPPPLDAAAEAELVKSLEPASDRLKSALARLGREVLSRTPRDR